jgi:GNAT superfamily N-acetyltransferase
MTISSPVDRITIRHDLRPGDIGGVAAMHGVEYGEQYGLDHTFEAHVAHQLADFGHALAADPNAGRLWVAEEDGKLVGSIAVTHETGTHARLRWFVIRRPARGQGLGHRLLDGALAYARERGFIVIDLETFSELRAAAHLYTDAGFAQLDATPMVRWGREIELRHYELTL